VILLGLTGGIGSGKSTVSAMLVAKGATLVDADAITREVQQPGSPVLAALAERFGADILDADGALLRQRLADRVFSDPEEVKALNAIVHPAVGEEIRRRLEDAREHGGVVVLDVPLLAENPRWPLSGTLVVDTDTEVAIDRLVRLRGMDEADARARIARQATREERRARADRVVTNDGDLAALRRQVDDVWAWAQQLPEAPEPAEEAAPEA
jgi:dephospho-CoA kinase